VIIVGIVPSGPVTVTSISRAGGSKLSTSSLTGPWTVEPAAGGTVRQIVKVQQGIPTDKAKEVVKFIKDGKFKVQASIQGETVRISGKDRDTLQEVIAALKAKDFGIDMQFDNYRSN